MFLLVVLCGAGAALAVAVGLNSWAAAPFDSVLSSLTVTGTETTAGFLSGFGVDAQLTSIAAAVAGILLPGLACLLLVEATKAGTSLRRAAALLLIIVGLASFLTVPFGQALVLFALSCLAAALLSLATGALLLAPIALATGFLSGRLVLAVTRGDLAALDRAQRLLTGYGDLGGYWPQALAAVALLPVLAAAGRLLRP